MFNNTLWNPADRKNGFFWNQFRVSRTGRNNKVYVSNTAHTYKYTSIGRVQVDVLSDETSVAATPVVSDITGSWM